MTKLFNIAEFLMIKTVSELGSWSFRIVNKQKKKKEAILCHLFPFSLIPIFKHIKYILHRQERERERERESQRGLPLLKLF